jgi:phospholipase/carboxylesterase
VRKRTGERPAPAGILALSGFVPTVDGRQASRAARTAARAFIAHGRSDPVIDVGFARQARELLQAGWMSGITSSAGGHYVDPAALSEAARWLGETVEQTPG